MKKTQWAITILDFNKRKVFTYELTESAIFHNGPYEIVEFLGHDVNNCEYMVHRMDEIEINLSVLESK